jgi:hypothetical protein
VSKDILGVFKSLSHLCVIAFESMIERQSLSLSLFVYICHKSTFRVEKNFCVILEIDLDNLVAQSKHNSVLGSHPFLHINWWV